MRYQNAWKPQLSSEFLTVREAAALLMVSRRTVEGWIRQKKLTADDGLRKVGPFWRIVAGVMRQRILDGTFMTGFAANSAAK